MKAQKKIPNNQRAICNGKIATIHNGRRIVRIYQSGEPLVGFSPKWAGQFDTFQDWVNHATRALTGETNDMGMELKAYCVDTKGRRCICGRDFQRARDEDAFPVRYFFESEVKYANEPV